jgi:hypothetical protein
VGERGAEVKFRPGAGAPTASSRHIVIIGIIRIVVGIIVGEIPRHGRPKRII